MTPNSSLGELQGGDAGGGLIEQDGQELVVRIEGSINRRPRRHVCPFCQRRFVRAEHLQRHVTSHENRKPFSCQTCGARYGRADVLHRHRKKCLATGQGVLHSEATIGGSTFTEATPIPRSEDDIGQPSITVARGSVADQGDHFTDAPPTDPLWSEHQARPADEIHTPPDSPTSIRSEEQANDNASTTSGQRGLDEANDAQTHTSSYLQPPSITGSTSRHLPIHSHMDAPSPALSSHFLFDLSALSSQTIEPCLRQGSTEGFPQLTASDCIFLEDSLLPEFNFAILDDPSSFGMPQRFEGQWDQSEASATGEILSSRTRHVTPTPSLSDAPESRPEYTAARQSFRGIRCSDEDVKAVQDAFFQANGSQANLEERIPSKSRISRFLKAYFEYFDPHTPIVHYPTFAISSTPGPLLLAMLSVGGCYLSEHEFAYKAYEAACRLLAKYDASLLSGSTPELWPIQATMLCVQVGGFSDNTLYLRQAQRHCSLATDLLRSAECELGDRWDAVYSDWSLWIYIETLSRLACWLCVLNSAILIFDPEAICLLAPQVMSRLPIPSNDGLWRASSSGSWSYARDSLSYAPNTMMDGIRKTCGTDIPLYPFSSFGLLGQIGCLLSHVCGRERSLYGLEGTSSREYVFKMERSLNMWERLWRRHPHAESVPSKHGDPLMSDCLSLLGSAYYHLYMGPELQILKRISRDPGCQLALPSFRPQREILKAVKYAASSWLVRAKLGIAHLQATAALEFGGHVLVTAYEGALVLAWWLNIRPEIQFSGDSEVLEGLRALDELFREIREELRDQRICGSQQTNLAILPLEFYGLLMRKWVWTYTTIMAQNINNFSLRLTAR